MHACIIWFKSSCEELCLHVGLGTGHAYKLTNIRYELDSMTFRPIEYCAPPNYKSYLRPCVILCPLHCTQSALWRDSDGIAVLNNYSICEWFVQLLVVQHWVNVRWRFHLLVFTFQFLGTLSLQSDCNVVAWALKASSGVCVGTSQGDVIHWCTHNEGPSITEVPFYAVWDRWTFNSFSFACSCFFPLLLYHILVEWLNSEAEHVHCIVDIVSKISSF